MLALPARIFRVRALACGFFFQAEDGIRDYKVTGVQTCALPIYLRPCLGYSREEGVSSFTYWAISASRNLVICWLKSTVWQSAENAITCSSAYFTTPEPVSKNCLI